MESTQQQRAAQDAARLHLDADTHHPLNWVEESAEYQRGFLSVSHLLADMNDLENDRELLALRYSETRVPVSERRYMKPVFAAAASLMIAIGAGLLLQGQQAVESIVSMDRYVTRIGEQRTVPLGDGSVIAMNTGSELLVSVEGDERKVILRRGEAYFDVAHNPDKPFVVEVGENSVTVLGTEFNIRKEPGKMQLAVNEGMVALHATEQVLNADAPLMSAGRNGTEPTALPVGQYRVSAGWVAEVNANKGQLQTYAPDSMRELSLWRTGVLDFDNVPLMDVVRELNRYSGKKILIEDASILGLKVTGVVQVDNISRAFQGLERVFPIEVTHHFDRIVLAGSESGF
ncbi:FecR domain-containing protein [Porticoccus sp. W117]|uniref:FecR family protein n=1 Tax=Porticoccus sp. W117 TaxID=3054777 RepID=UPI00259ABDA6|nr:FecR domain-containing protein [Porticoccus sp. W117]MDM3870698.1 FecR domain-containing protein [Porticoccus sp. W117]